MVWGIASADPVGALERFRDELHITFPILVDTGGTVQDAYAQEWAFETTRYPNDWIVGADGTVRYKSNTWDAGEMIEIIEEELAP